MQHKPVPNFPTFKILGALTLQKPNSRHIYK
jgi:hypothetical protein